jgi:hypothetical protein
MVSRTPNNEGQDVLVKDLRDWFMQNASKALRKLQRELHFKFPNLFLDFPENRAYHKEIDAKENGLSKVPLDEELRQSAIWGVDLYGPKEISTLYENIEKLGWAGSRFGIPDSDVLEWVRRARRYGYTGPRNLGVVYRPKEKGPGRDYFSPMPNACKYLLVSVNQITPSLTAIHVYFVLNEESSKLYETILNTDRRTFYRRFKGRKGYSIPGVLNQKKELIEKARLERAQIASSWFAQHLPGLFSGGPLVDELPTGELITMNNHVALKDPKEDKGEELKWPNLLGIDRWFDGWLHPKHDGFGLILDEERNNKKYHSIVTLTTSRLPDDHYLFSSGRDWGAYNAIVHQELGGIAIRLAASDYLKEIGRRIRDARESVGQASKNRVTLIDTLDRLETFYRDAIGDPAIAEELSRLEEHHFKWDCTKFVSKTLSRSETVELPSALHNMTNRIADSVHADGQSARQLFQEFASTLSIRESIRAQRRMEILTIFAIVIAVIGAVIGVTGK